MKLECGNKYLPIYLSIYLSISQYPPPTGTEYDPLILTPYPSQLPYFSYLHKYHISYPPPKEWGLGCGNVIFSSVSWYVFPPPGLYFGGWVGGGPSPPSPPQRNRIYSTPINIHNRHCYPIPIPLYIPMTPPLPINPPTQHHPLHISSYLLFPHIFSSYIINQYLKGVINYLMDSFPEPPNTTIRDLSINTLPLLERHIVP